MLEILWQGEGRAVGEVKMKSQPESHVKEVIIIIYFENLHFLHIDYYYYYEFVLSKTSLRQKLI